MHFTLIHGWAFDRHFWQPLIAAMPQHEFDCVDCGYFGEPQEITGKQPSILVGHSLGFMLGMRMKADWLGWIAINSFPFFTSQKNRAGCVPLATLRAMKKQLTQNPQKTLADFYQKIDGTTIPQGNADSVRLAAALDILEHEDISDVIATTTLPHLVLAGAQDPLVPVEISQLLQINQSEFHLHPSAGHCLPQHEAVWCADKINQFLATNFSYR